MKHLFLLLLTLSVAMASAEPGGDKALAELSQRVKDLGHYTAEIRVTAGASTIEGSYSVSGKDYHINMGSVELWGDENHRYEVSHKIEEVVVSTPSQSDNLLLSNPTSAFNLAELGFEAVADGNLITLTPTDSSSGLDVDAIEVWVGQESSLPAKIIYRADGESVEIELLNMKSVKSPFQKINTSKYKRYDWVNL